MRISDWSSDVCSSDLFHTSSARPRTGLLPTIRRRWSSAASILPMVMGSFCTGTVTGSRALTVAGGNLVVRARVPNSPLLNRPSGDSKSTGPSPTADQARVEVTRLWVEVAVRLVCFDDAHQLVHGCFHSGGVALQIVGHHAVPVEDLVAG